MSNILRMSILYIVWTAFVATVLLADPNDNLAKLELLAKLRNNPELAAKYQMYNAEMKRLAEERGIRILNSNLLLFDSKRYKEDNANSGTTVIGSTLCFGHTVISIHMLDSAIMNLSVSENIETINHELAHAKDCMNRGTTDHEQPWKEIAIRYGAVPEAVRK